MHFFSIWCFFNYDYCCHAKMNKRLIFFFIMLSRFCVFIFFVHNNIIKNRFDDWQIIHFENFQNRLIDNRQNFVFHKSQRFQFSTKSSNILLIVIAIIFTTNRRSFRNCWFDIVFFFHNRNLMILSMHRSIFFCSTKLIAIILFHRLIAHCVFHRMQTIIDFDSRWSIVHEQNSIAWCSKWSFSFAIWRWNVTFIVDIIRNRQHFVIWIVSFIAAISNVVDWRFFHDDELFITECVLNSRWKFEIEQSLFSIFLTKNFQMKNYLKIWKIQWST